MQPAQLVEHQAVDEVMGGNAGIPGQGLLDDADPGGGGMAGRANGHEGFPGTQPPQPAIRFHLRHVAVVRQVAHLAGEVPAGPVLEQRADQQLLPASHLQHGLGRVHFHGPDAGARGSLRPKRRSLLHPPQQRLVIFRFQRQLQPTLMGLGQGRLPQQQALFGFFPIDSRSLGPGIGRQDLVGPPPDDPAVVLLRVDAVERQLESSSSLHPSMAMGVVAAPAGQYPFDVPGKAQGRPVGPALDLEPHRGRPGPQASRHAGDTLGQGLDPPLGRDRRHTGIGEFPPDERGHIPLQPVAIAAHHQKLAGGPRPLQRHRLGHDPDRQQLRFGSFGPERDGSGCEQDPRQQDGTADWLHLKVTLPTPSPTVLRPRSPRPPCPRPRDGR